MLSFKRGILFGLSILTRSGIIFLQFEGRGLQKFFRGKPPDPHFSHPRNHIQLGTAGLIRCIEIGFHKLILFNTFRGEWGT